MKESANNGKKDFSTAPGAPQKDTRIHAEDGDPGRAPNACQKAQEGPLASFRGTGKDRAVKENCCLKCL